MRNIIKRIALLFPQVRNVQSDLVNRRNLSEELLRKIEFLKKQIQSSIKIKDEAESRADTASEKFDELDVKYGELKNKYENLKIKYANVSRQCAVLKISTNNLLIENTKPLKEADNNR